MTSIRTPDQRLRVFISSTMKELAGARAAARAAIEGLRLIPVLFELGARPYPPRELYLAYLRQSDVFVGIYGQQYGWIAPGQEISGLEDEYLAAADKPKLVYVQSPAPDRDPRLAAMLTRISSDGLSYRGFSRPEELSALIADDLALLLSERFDIATTPRDDTAQRRHRTRLPVPATRFIGRDHDLAVLRDLLTAGETRLVTLVGSGGIGKTRLAIEAATAVDRDFDDTVMVELESVPSAELVPSSIASSLGIPETPGRSVVDSLTDHLASRRMLLVVDNFEHVVAAAPVLAHLLTRTTRLTLLVTSRERLRLSGERVFEVEPLGLPRGDDDVEATRQAESVQLFVDRARAAGSDLHLGPDQLRVLAEICRRLDGLPLAIELAASRVRMLGADELLRRLDRRLGILTGGSRDLPARQQALRSTIAWSHDLLDELDRTLFARLGVFSGGFSLAAAEAVCTDDVVPHVLEGISSLVDKTLLRTDDPLQGQPRFTMLQVVREFAVDQLDATGEADRIRRAHADFFERLVIGAEARWRQGGGRHVVEEYLADQANVRGAMGWALDIGETGRVARMGLAMWPFWWTRGLFTEGIEVMERALLDESALAGQDRAHALLVLGMLAFGRGDYERAVPSLQQAMDHYDELGDGRGVATASVPLGVIDAVRHPDRGVDLLERSVSQFRALEDAWNLSFALLSLGGALRLHDRDAEAVAPLQESVELARGVTADVFLSHALINLGWVHLRLGDINSARRRLNESLEHAVAIDSREGLARALDALAAVAGEAGNPEHGAALFGAAEGARRSIGADVFATDRTSHDETAERLHSRLGEPGYRTATDRGRTLSLEEVLKTASAV
jgi:predicted ATPase